MTLLLLASVLERKFNLLKSISSGNIRYALSLTNLLDQLYTLSVGDLPWIWPT